MCNYNGNNKNHNCTLCAKDYIYEMNFINNINCYKKCDYYTFYNPNNNKSYCTPDLSCPDEFNKLIPNKNICIAECYKDKDYPFEFRHICYKKCSYNISLHTILIKR